MRDDDLLLRPWTTADVEESHRLLDADLVRWLGLPTMPPTVEQHAAWVDETHGHWADSRSKATFLVEWRGKVAGSVDVEQVADGVGSLSWLVYAPYRRRGIASRAVRLLIEFAFRELGLSRVEAHVDPLNRSSLGVALRAGLRREGLLRGNVRLGTETHDTVVLGRLSRDPAPGSREGFTAMLDSALPVKRAISQGVLRNERGDVLLCELAYKAEWDLPGGVVDPDESPARCVVREIEEELGLAVQPVGLLAVNWMPPWLGWRDAVLLVFDLGTAASDIIESLVLEDREIRAAHWADESVWTERVAPYTARMLRSVMSSGLPGPAAPYLEDGLPTLGTPPRT
ncbi:hypothetical protein IDVR_25530 [Intrasporangium sp. DVR]